MIRSRLTAVRGAAILAIAAGILAVPSQAAAQPVSCPTATVSTAIPFTIPVLDWSENLTYDNHGNLWVTRTQANVVQRYDAKGNVTATVHVESPGAAKMGRDGLLYVLYGDSYTGFIPGHGGGVVRFDPAAAAPVPQPFVGGLTWVNGAAFDSEGYLYIAEQYVGVVRVRPDGTIDREWSDKAKNIGVDGVAVVGRDVYVTILTSITGQVLRVPIDDPAHPTVLANLTPDAVPVPALPDDMAVASDGTVYVATTTGRLVRIDPVTHGVCTVLTGEPITSATFVPGSDRDLMVGTETGNVLRVHLN